MDHVLPKVTEVDGRERHEHPAFGMASISVVRGGIPVLFGSEVGHMSCVRVSVKRAHLDRHLCRDWHHSEGTLVEFEMSHAQFAQWITGVGSTGIPVTLTRAAPIGTKAEQVPGIEKLVSAHDTFRKEVKDMARKSLEDVVSSVAAIEKELSGASISKTRMKQLVFELKNRVANTPSNMAFVVTSAEEALDHATTAAKIEVEAYIDHTVKAVGLKSMQEFIQLGELKE